MAPHSDPVATIRRYIDSHGTSLRRDAIAALDALVARLAELEDKLIDADEARGKSEAGLLARLEQAEAWIKAAMETGDSGLVAALKQAEAELEEDTQVIQQQQKAVEDLEAALKNMEAEHAKQILEIQQMHYRAEEQHVAGVRAECEVLRQQRDTLTEALEELRALAQTWIEYDALHPKVTMTGPNRAKIIAQALAPSLVVVDPSDPSLAVPHFETNQPRRDG